MIRIGIDPGVRECGVAIEHARDRAAFLVRSSEPQLTARALDMCAQVFDRVPCVHAGTQINLCVEGQQIYRSENAKGDPNDMIKLATVAGVIAGSLGTILEAWTEMPLPREWKGSVPKKIHHARLARDFPHWGACVERDTPKSLQHHVWDAVGLLEWHRERSNR